MKRSITFLIGLFVTLVLVKTILSSFIPTISIFSDEYLYAKMAQSFFIHGNFFIHGVPTSQYPPLYPMLLSIAYSLSNMKLVYFGMKLINAILSSFIIFPAYLIAKDFMKDSKAKIITTLIGILPFSFAFSSYLMSENLFYPLVLFCVYFIYKNFSENSLLWQILVGVFLALVTLTRITGFILVIVFILTAAIQWIIHKKFNIKSLLIPLSLLIVLWVPWMIRNGHYFGWSLLSVLGLQGYSHLGNTFVKIPLLQLGTRFFFRAVFSMGYLLLGAGIFFGLFSFLTLKKEFLKDKKSQIFFSVCALTILGFIAITTKHGSAQSVYSLPSFLDYSIGGRIIGRYIDPALPVVMLLGFISLVSIPIEKEHILRISLFGGVILILTSLVSLFVLMPVNNMSAVWVGILSYLLNLLLLGTITPGFFSWLPLILLASFFVCLIFLFFYMYKKGWLNLQKLIIPFFIFFLILSLVNYGLTFYNSEIYWNHSPQNEAGKWLNSYDADSWKTVLYDERDCLVRIIKEDQRGICEPSHSATISGFWINKEILIGDVSNLGDADYIISMHELAYTNIYDQSGIKIYRR